MNLNTILKISFFSANCTCTVAKKKIENMNIINDQRVLLSLFVYGFYDLSWVYRKKIYKTITRFTVCTIRFIVVGLFLHQACFHALGNMV